MSWTMIRPSRVLFAGGLSAATLSSIYLRTSRPLYLDSGDIPPTKTLSFPKSMLLSQTLTVTHVEQVSHDTKRITFSLPTGPSSISGVGAGGAILTQHTPAGGWVPVFRPYTPISDPEEQGTVQLLVKKYPGGRASGHLHSLQPGQGLTVRGPLPGYSIPEHTPEAKAEEETPRELLMIAGGAGITPIYSLAKGILANPRDNKTKLRLLWGVNGVEDVVLLKELEALEMKYPEQVQVTYYISGPEEKIEERFPGGEGKYQKGRIGKSVLQEAIAKVSEGGNWGDKQGKKVFMCGPPAMEKGLAGTGGVLSELGVEKKAVQTF